LVRLGIGWIWMGIEGKGSKYNKLNGVDTRSLVKQLQSHGIRVLGSSIIGLEDHKPENMDAIIDYAVGHDTVFHQFMLYTPISGTPLYEKHKKDGTLLSESEFAVADTHGQYRFNYRHPYIEDGKEENYLLNAFWRDFTVNGPSLLRLIRVQLNGWQMYKNHSNKRVRDRFAREVIPLRSSYAGAVWAIRKLYLNDERIAKKANMLLKDIYSTFGWKTRLITPLIGRFAFYTFKKEEERLAKGWTYEPSFFYEKNEAAIALEKSQTIKHRAHVQQNSPVVSKSIPTYAE